MLKPSFSRQALLTYPDVLRKLFEIFISIEMRGSSGEGTSKLCKFEYFLTDIFLSKLYTKLYLVFQGARLV